MENIDNLDKVVTAKVDALKIASAMSTYVKLKLMLDKALSDKYQGVVVSGTAVEKKVEHTSATIEAWMRPKE